MIAGAEWLKALAYKLGLGAVAASVLRQPAASQDLETDAEFTKKLPKDAVSS